MKNRSFQTVRKGSVLSRTAFVVFSAALVGAVLLPGDGTTATVPLPPVAACCFAPLTLGQAIVSPPNGGDKDFFATPPGPPSVMFLFGNNDSMQEYASPFPTSAATGCTDPTLVTPMAAFFDLTSTDPAKNGSVPFDNDPDFSTSSTQFWDPLKVYLTTNVKLPYQGDGSSPYTVATNFRATNGYATAAAACTAYGFTGALATSAGMICQGCLATKGWYRGASNKWVVSGRVLNVHPPKFAIARKVLKDVLLSVDNVRFGAATFGPNVGFYDPPVIIHPVKPGCDKSFPVIDVDEGKLARNDMLKQINSIVFTNDERSIGEALFGIGGYFSSEQADGRWSKWFKNAVMAPSTNYPGSSGWVDTPEMYIKAGQPWESGGQNKSVCWACQSSAVIVLTDGSPFNDNSVPVSRMLNVLKAEGAKHDDGTALTYTPNTASPGGVNYCDQFGSTKVACDAQQAGPQGPDATNKNFMDDVAFFLSHQDLRDDYGPTAGTNEGLNAGQRVKVYTIGYGDNSPMLQSIAKAGRGKFYPANNSQQLRDAIINALTDVRETATSFSGAALSSIQTSGNGASAFIPRFNPRASQPYEGHLYRFATYSEFVEGCDPAKAKLGTEPLDLNKDKDCEDTFILDKPASFVMGPGKVPLPTDYTASNIVSENKNGDWVKVNTASYNANGELVNGTAAVPFWDAQTVLQSKSASSTCAAGGRCIFTMVDRDNDGKFTAADNPPVEFVKTNLANAASQLALQSYLFGAGDDFCVELFARQKKVYGGTPTDRTACGNSLIDFIRGVDVLDFDGDGNVTEDRPCSGELPGSTKSCKLGDIFHSTPVTVDPPVEPFICDLALNPQCARTLYADFVADGAPPVGEPLCTAASTGATSCYEATPMAPPIDLKAGDYGAYGAYKTSNASRDRVVVVGANDGMLHAFLGGKAISGKTKKGFVDDIHDLGTGEEIWAFIPPDLLPKLGRLVKHHEYFVDGTPMVRDIWADGSGATAKDGKKQADEFKTVAIITERGGGSRYLALDLTDPYAMTKSASTAFRWIYPQPCDTESATIGQTWSNFSPKPPPIGPVRIKNTSAQGNGGHLRGWDEKWIVFLNGGYSPTLTRGRGVYMVDAWSGSVVWSFTAAAPLGGDGDDYKDSVKSMMFPMAAAPALLDVGKVEGVKPDQDGFFDTAIVPDIGGQVWTFRFFEPGDTGSGQASNWFGARSFESRRVDAKFNDSRAYDDKMPFFNITSNTLQPETGWLRTFLGSGDRENLRDTESRACSPDNLLACSRLECDVKVNVEQELNGATINTQIEFTDGKLTKNETTRTGTVGSVCVASRFEVKNLDINCTPPASLGTRKYTYNTNVKAGCALAAGLWDCSVKENDIDSRGDLQVPATDLALLPKNRYYGYHSYGGSTLRFADATDALAFDKRRATDINWTGSCTATNGCALKDVSIPASAYTACTDASSGKTYQCVAPSYSFARAGPFDRGWYIEYDQRDEKTAAGSAILGGIVFWPTYRPPSANVTPCAPAASGDHGRSWQADIVTGAPDQALSFQVRDAAGNLTGIAAFKERNVSSPPPEPAATISVSKNGRIRYGIEIIEPGPGDGSGGNNGSGKANAGGVNTETLRENADIASDIYWLEVSRGEHMCRHVDSAACQ